MVPTTVPFRVQAPSAWHGYPWWASPGVCAAVLVPFIVRRALAVRPANKATRASNLNRLPRFTGPLPGRSRLRVGTAPRGLGRRRLAEQMARAALRRSWSSLRKSSGPRAKIHVLLRASKYMRICPLRRGRETSVVVNARVRRSRGSGCHDGSWQVYDAKVCFPTGRRPTIAGHGYHCGI